MVIVVGKVVCSIVCLISVGLKVLYFNLLKVNLLRVIVIMLFIKAIYRGKVGGRVRLKSKLVIVVD